MFWRRETNLYLALSVFISRPIPCLLSSSLSTLGTIVKARGSWNRKTFSAIRKPNCNTLLTTSRALTTACTSWYNTRTACCLHSDLMCFLLFSLYRMFLSWRNIHLLVLLWSLLVFAARFLLKALSSLYLLVSGLHGGSFWWTNWHWDRFLFKYFRFLLSV